MSAGLAVTVTAVATVVYAAMTGWIIYEMRVDRLRATKPDIRLDFDYRKGGVVFPRIVNVGPPAANGLNLEFVLDRRGNAPEVVPVRRPLLAPGDDITIVLPGQELTWKELSAAFSTVSLSGAYQGPDGRHHKVSQRIDDLEGWFESSGVLHQLLD
jgi:hypothetical protein